MPKKGGTITVSNVGAIGRGEFAMPVLVPGGGVAIVALGRARWVDDLEVNKDGVRLHEGILRDVELMRSRYRTGGGHGERGKGGGVRLKIGVSWSADHRVIEGAELAAFMECWRGWVENPSRLIGEGR